MIRLAGAHSRTPLAVLSLVIVTAIWGSTFVLIKDLVATLPVTDFLAVRFIVAAAVLVVAFWRQVRRLSREEMLRGGALGVVYGLAQILQTAGLDRSSAAVSGFVTGMYVVLTPILAALLLRQRTSRSVWLAVALSTVGLALLALRGLSVGSGELLVLGSAALYAVHIVGLARWSVPGDALALSAVQMVTIAVVCSLGAIPGGVVLPDGVGQWSGVLYTALAAGALALVLQTWAQGHLSAARAAVIMTMEPVFAALFAVLVGGEHVTVRMLAGGTLVLAAMYLVELAPGREPQTEPLPVP
jgi:drug/metabolite transporter (DMT)-like permease